MSYSLIALIFLFSQTNSLALTNKPGDSITDSSVSLKKKFIIGVHIGYRFNISSSPDLKSNPFFGFLIQLPLSEFVSIQPEINFWKTDILNRPTETNLAVTDIPILLTLNVNYENTGVDLAIGPGVIVQHNIKDKLISLNIGVGYWIKLLESIRLTFNFRLQSAGSLDVGGGNSITSIYLCTGLKYQIGS